MHWTLQNAVLEDQSGVGSDPLSNLTGSFTYDADAMTYSAISIQTDGSDLYPGLNFTGGDVVGKGVDFLVTVEAGGPPDLTDEPVLLLVFLEALTNSGGTVSLDLPSAPGNSFATNIANCSDDICSGAYGPPSAWAISGEVVGQAVPVPAAAWLFGSALSLFGWLRHRSPKRASVAWLATTQTGLGLSRLERG